MHHSTASDLTITLDLKLGKLVLALKKGFLQIADASMLNLRDIHLPFIET